jgi:hypothetical protein
MIRHLVLFKLNDGVAKDDPRVVAGVDAFNELGKLVPELREWQCGWNVTDRDIAYDFAINSLVDDGAALQAYLTHPAHQAGVGLWKQFATWIIADFEV